MKPYLQALAVMLGILALATGLAEFPRETLTGLGVLMVISLYFLIVEMFREYNK